MRAAPYGLKVKEDCHGCISSSSSMFTGLGRPILERLIGIRQLSLYPAHSTLFVEGEAPRGLFVLCDGRARLIVTSRVGKRLTLRHVNPCEPMDLDAVMSDSPHYASCETLTPSQIGFFPKKEFVALLRANEDLSMRVHQQLSREVRRAWDHACLLSLAPGAKAKLAGLLIARAGCYGETNRNGPRIRVPLIATAEQVGEEIGCSRETVSRLLSNLKREGIIRINGAALVILKLDALRELTGML